MDFRIYFEQYEKLVQQVDNAFVQVKEKYPHQVKHFRVGDVIPCRITASGTPNIRTEPSTTSSIASTMNAGTAYLVLNQTEGADGFIWWRIGEGQWVRSDVVEEDGDCAAVPTTNSP